MPNTSGDATNGSVSGGVRAIALVGPAGAGKTSLAEALLARSGAIGAPGSLERGTTTSDFDPLERRAGHSLASALLPGAHHIVLTGGHQEAVTTGRGRDPLRALERALGAALVARESLVA